jgi:hypothetical protein
MPDATNIHSLAGWRFERLAGLRRAAERTREDLGPDGTNYPDVRVLLAFAESALAAAPAVSPGEQP